MSQCPSFCLWHPGGLACDKGQSIQLLQVSVITKQDDHASVWTSWCCSVQSAVKILSTKLSVSHSVIFLTVRYSYLLSPGWDLRTYLQSAWPEHLTVCLRLYNRYFPFCFCMRLKFIRLPYNSAEEISVRHGTCQKPRYSAKMHFFNSAFSTESKGNSRQQ